MRTSLLLLLLACKNDNAVVRQTGRDIFHQVPTDEAVSYTHLTLPTNREV